MPPLAQTTTTQDVRNFEVISVDGNKLVARDQNGTEEITVPDDFRFTVDGKKVPVSELKPGMKGTATITTKTTVTPVVVTEIKEGVVLRAEPRSVTVRGADGVRQRFTQEQLDERDIQIVKDGRVVRINQLHEGDVLTAAIVSKSTAGRGDGKGSAGDRQRLQGSAPAPTMAAAAPAAQPPAAAPAPQPSHHPAGCAGGRAIRPWADGVPADCCNHRASVVLRHAQAKGAVNILPTDAGWPRDRLVGLSTTNILIRSLIPREKDLQS